MQRALTSYVLCATPRSGSTLLCRMLAATSVAGRPNSYFPRRYIREWAESWGVPSPDGVDAPEFDGAYLAAMKREGSAATGIFGLRLMWENVPEADERLSRTLGTDHDIVQNLEAAFGATLFIHLSRQDKVAQAVSLIRAEQSGLWHLAADGTVLEGEKTARPMSYNHSRIAETVESLRSGDAAWSAFFTEREIAPLRMTYEAISADPNAALRVILVALGIDPEAGRNVEVQTARIADAESRRWVERFRAETGTSG